MRQSICKNFSWLSLRTLITEPRGWLHQMVVLLGNFHILLFVYESLYKRPLTHHTDGCSSIQPGKANLSVRTSMWVVPTHAIVWRTLLNIQWNQSAGAQDLSNLTIMQRRSQDQHDLSLYGSHLVCYVYYVSRRPSSFRVPPEYILTIIAIFLTLFYSSYHNCMANMLVLVTLKLRPCAGTARFCYYASAQYLLGRERTWWGPISTGFALRGVEICASPCMHM